MATKVDGLFCKQQFTLSNDSRINKSNKFTDLNLHQSYKSSNDQVSPVQSFSKSKNDQNYSYTVTVNVKDQTWNKSAKDSTFKTSKNRFSIVDAEEKRRRKRWMNDKNSSNAKNASTLSLHIAAYENSIEAVANESDYLSLKSKAFKNVDFSKIKHGINQQKIQKDVFEFPRQQDDNKPAAPEVQQFKASQKLLSPNQSAPVPPSSSEIQPPAVENGKGKALEISSSAAPPSTTASEADSQKELKKEVSEKSEKSDGKSEGKSGGGKSEGKEGKKKSPKKKKSSKKRSSSKSHQSKKKDRKNRGEKSRRSQEEPAISTIPSSPADADGGGETLAPCSEKEWEHGSAAYHAALLNVKRKPNRVTVFALKKKGDKDGKSPASPKNTDASSSGSLRSVSSKKLKKKSKEGKMDRADQIGKIVAGIVRKYLDGKNEESIQVEIKLISRDGTSSTPVIP